MYYYIASSPNQLQYNILSRSLSSFSLLSVCTSNASLAFRQQTTNEKTAKDTTRRIKTRLNSYRVLAKDGICIYAFEFLLYFEVKSTRKTKAYTHNTQKKNYNRNTAFSRGSLAPRCSSRFHQSSSTTLFLKKHKKTPPVSPQKQGSVSAPTYDKTKCIASHRSSLSHTSSHMLRSKLINLPSPHKKQKRKNKKRAPKWTYTTQKTKKLPAHLQLPSPISTDPPPTPGMGTGGGVCVWREGGRAQENLKMFARRTSEACCLKRQRLKKNKTRKTKQKKGTQPVRIVIVSGNP